MQAYQTSLDICNQMGKLLGQPQVQSLTSVSKIVTEFNNSYDKLRQAELRRNVWRFATRKAILRPIDSTVNFFVPQVYSAASTYNAYDIVSDSNGTLWQTMVPTTAGQTPGLATSPWELYFGPLTVSTYDTTGETAYYAGELVNDSGAVYLSLINGNTDVPPTSNWYDLGNGLYQPFNIIYPLGSGPVEQSDTRNVFRLPAGYLRTAPQDPKRGSVSFLGGPSYNRYDDWEYENVYLTSFTSDVIVFRFIADMTFVPTFDPMFCEGLSLRLAIDNCETITQSSDKLARLGAMYKEFMGDARIVNGIETGATEPPEDDYIATRL